MKMEDLEAIIESTQKASDTVKAKLEELEKIHNEIEERKKRWALFDNLSGQKSKLIGELTQLLAECDEEYKKNVIGCEVFNSSNTGLGQVNGEMKGHHDYEIKQTSIIQHIEKYNKL